MGKKRKTDELWSRHIELPTLAEQAFIAVGPKEHHRCIEAFRFMGLPVPEKEGSYPRTNSSLFFLTEEGLEGAVIYRRKNSLLAVAQRAGFFKSAGNPVYRAAFEAVSDTVNQPVATIPLTDNAVLQLSAGVAPLSAGGREQVQAMRQTLKPQGLSLTDEITSEMMGTIPDADEGGSLEVVWNSRMVHIANSSLVPGKAPLQDRIFGEEREMFTAAIESGRNELMAKAFRQCAQKAALDPEDPRRIYTAPWAERPPQTIREREVAEIAQAYRRQRHAAL